MHELLDMLKTDWKYIIWKESVKEICDYVFVFFLEIWRALLKEMPLQSVLRILGKMTSNKILEPGGPETQAVCDRIQSETALNKVGPVDLSH